MPRYETLTGHQRCIEWQGKEFEVPSDSDPTQVYIVTVDWSVLNNRIPMKQYPFRKNPWHCTCDAYKFRRGNEGYCCKHIKAVEGEKCHYDSCVDGSGTEQQKIDNICPEYGGETDSYLVGEF